jgi:hypothetical protein
MLWGMAWRAVLCYVQAEHKIQSADGPLLLQLQKVRGAATTLALQQCRKVEQGRAGQGRHQTGTSAAGQGVAGHIARAAQGMA